MKNRKLVCSFIFSIFIVGCSAPPAPSAEPSATQGVAIFTSVPIATIPATITIPLPQPSLIIAATVPVPVIGSLLPLASPNSGPLNCRGSPDVRWPVGAVLNPGENAQIVGRNADSTWWYVKNPSAPAGSCWISAAFATVTGDVSGVQIVVVAGVPPPVNGTPVGTITSVYILLEPDTIDAPGCVGPSQLIKIIAKITVNGPVEFTFHFEGDEVDDLRDHKWGFTRADIDDVTDSFIPPLNAGTHRIFLVVDDMDLQGVGSVATYTINC